MINPTPKEKWISWVITSDLKMWHSGTARNYGNMIKIKHEINASDQIASFYPKEGDQPQILKPKLIVKIDWYKTIDSTPAPTSSPTPSPTMTPTYTPLPTIPTTTPAPTIPTDSPKPTQPQQNPNLLMTTVITALLIVAAIITLHFRNGLKGKRGRRDRK